MTAIRNRDQSRTYILVGPDGKPGTTVFRIRVVKKDGTLSGYRWGVERKRALLRKEAHA